jgi:hypothetical protein
MCDVRNNVIYLNAHLNHSIRADEDGYTFTTLRIVRRGDELTVDYRTYGAVAALKGALTPTGGLGISRAQDRGIRCLASSTRASETQRNMCAAKSSRLQGAGLTRTAAGPSTSSTPRAHIHQRSQSKEARCRNVCSALELAVRLSPVRCLAACIRSLSGWPASSPPRLLERSAASWWRNPPVAVADIEQATAALLSGNSQIATPSYSPKAR